MSSTLNKLIEAQNSENDDLYGRLSQDEIKRLFYRDYDGSIELSRLSQEIIYYIDED